MIIQLHTHACVYVWKNGMIFIKYILTYFIKNTLNYFTNTRFSLLVWISFALQSVHSNVAEARNKGVILVFGT